MSNVKRIKKLILSNKETKRLYRRMQFLAIFMIVSCLVIIAIAKWGEYDQNKKREEIFGSWDEVFLNVDQEDLNYFRKNSFLEQISVQSIQEKIFLEGDQRVVIGACDENFLEMGNIELLKGRMPEHEKEISIEKEYLNILGVSDVGDVVPENSKVEFLKGYRVIGIVENYSKYWKMINQDIKYINCFVSNAVENENQVFIKYGLWSNDDPEINMISYRKNVSFAKFKLMNYFMRIIALILICQLLLAHNINKEIRRFEEYNKSIENTFLLALLFIMLIIFFFKNSLALFLSIFIIILWLFLSGDRFELIFYKILRVVLLYVLFLIVSETLIFLAENQCIQFQNIDSYKLEDLSTLKFNSELVFFFRSEIGGKIYLHLNGVIFKYLCILFSVLELILIFTILYIFNNELYNRKLINKKSYLYVSGYFYLNEKTLYKLIKSNNGNGQLIADFIVLLVFSYCKYYESLPLENHIANAFICMAIMVCQIKISNKFLFHQYKKEFMN